MGQDALSEGAPAATLMPVFGARTVGFALYLAWAMAAPSLFMPASADHSVSPFLACCLGAVALVVFCYYSYRTDAGSFTPAWMKSFSLASVLAGGIAEVLVLYELLPPWALYVAALVLGFCSAVFAFVWALVYAEGRDRRATASAMFALLLGCALDYGTMAFAGEGIPWVITAFLLGSWVCLLFSLRGAVSKVRPVIVRPRHTREFVVFGIGTTLFALALGIAGGTTAEVSTPESVGTLNAGVARVGLIIAAIAFVAAAAFPRRVEPTFLLKVLAPCVVVVMLANVVDFSHADLWLTITMFAWDFLAVCLFLVLVAVDQTRTVSLPLAFPVGWAILWAGYSAGVFLGQNLFPVMSEGAQAMINSVVAVALIVVVSLAFLLGNRLVFHLSETAQAGWDLGKLGKGDDREKQPDAPNRDASGVGEASGEPGESAVSGGAEDAASLPEKASAPSDATSALEEPAASALEERCERLAAFYKLSARETEVFALLAQGHTRAAIAKKLFVSENTVREHVKNIYKKLSIHSRQQLIDLVDTRR